MDLAAVIAGRGPAPSLVLALARALPDTCLTVALASGGRDHHGWGVHRYLLADIYDAINANTRATGHWKGKPPTIAPWPRPAAANTASADAPAVTVAALYHRFAGR